MQSKQPSTDEWTKKIHTNTQTQRQTHTDTHTHTHTHTHTEEYYSAMKKNEILPLEATQMTSEGTMLSTEKNKYYISLVCGILK